MNRNKWMNNILVYRASSLISYGKWGLDLIKCVLN